MALSFHILSNASFMSSYHSTLYSLRYSKNRKIISNGKKKIPFWATDFLKRFFYSWELDYPDFTSLDFAKIIYFTEQGRQPWVHPKPGGPDLCIYVSQWQAGITRSTGLPFRRLLRLAGLRWRYSNPPPHVSIVKLLLWLYSPLLGLGRYFSFFILYTVGRTPWTGDHPVTRPLPTHRTAQTQNKRTQTSMPWVGFEPRIPSFERAKAVHALDPAVPVIGWHRECICSVEGPDNREQWIGKDVEGRGSGLIYGAIPEFACRCWWIK
jgi:hypothetical protein